jgi:hypothetical protein
MFFISMIYATDTKGCPFTVYDLKKISYILLNNYISYFIFCKKDVTGLPAAWQSAANTFGCKIDGNFSVPAGLGIVPVAPKLEARIAGADLYMNARNFVLHRPNLYLRFL